MIYDPEEDEKILLNQLKEFKISNSDFVKMLHEQLDREIRESKLAGPKKIAVFSISGEVYKSSFAGGIIEEKNLIEMRRRADVVIPAINMVKYFVH